MKRPALVIVALCALLLLAAVVPAGASSRHPFRGVWRGIDTDGSNITLRFVEESRSGGNVYTVRGHDDRTGEWCGGPADAVAVAVTTEAENVLEASITWWCLPDGHSMFSFLQDHFTYDPSTDTMTTDDGTLYHRGR